MQVYTNSKGVEFALIGDDVIKCTKGEGMSFSTLTKDMLIKAIRSGVLTYAGVMTVKSYIEIADAIRFGKEWKSKNNK